MWTRLKQPALAGTQSICLQQQIDWAAGSSIIVASTSHWHGYSNPSETEEAIIENVTANGYCLDLKAPLKFYHMAESRQTAGPEDPASSEFRDRRIVPMHAEVALLTQNVKVQGDDDSVYPAEYGVQIHVHSHGHDSSTVLIENVEMWRAGQGYRLGRYVLLPAYYFMLTTFCLLLTAYCLLLTTYQ